MKTAIETQGQWDVAGVSKEEEAGQKKAARF